MRFSCHILGNLRATQDKLIVGGGAVERASGRENTERRKGWRETGRKGRKKPGMDEGEEGDRDRRLLLLFLP